MTRSTHGLLACLLFFITLATSTEVNAEQSPLLKIAQDLHCVKSEQDATALLAKLAKLPIEPFGIPSEDLTNTQSSELYAATADILLHVLYETTQRYPKLQETVEQIALLWNYCELINDGDLADLLASKQEGIIKREAIGPFPANKQGFEIWGFTKYANSHYVPEMLKLVPLYPRAYQDLLYRLTAEQCFPHPDIDTLQNEVRSRPYGGTLHLTPALEPGKKYPFFWQQQCGPMVTKKTKIPPPHRIPKNTVIRKNSIKRLENNVNEQAHTSVVKLEAQTIVLESKVSPKPIDSAAFVSLPKLVKTMRFRPVLKPKPKSKPSIKKMVMPVSYEKTILSVSFKKYTQPNTGEIPVISAAIPSGNSNAGAPLPLPPENGLGIAGNFYHRAKLTGAMSLGANGSWKPFSYFFVRGGINYNYLPDSGKFSYSWGIGYDDWHPGTFSAQINNWGPVSGNGSPFSGAVANFGYKFKADFLKPYHLSGSAAINVPFSGESSVSTTWVWSPIEHWFVRAGLSAPLTNPSGLNWSYGFGYSDWHPFTFSLTYDNWGSNPIFDSSQSDRFNFVENGAISLSWGFAF